MFRDVIFIVGEFEKSVARNMIFRIREYKKSADMFPTFHQGNLPMLATARDTAGLRCPPETPPDTSMPSSAPRPQLRGTRDSEPLVLMLVC